MQHVHFCIESIDPSLGGMEASARRLLQSARHDAKRRWTAYSLTSGLATNDLGPHVEIVDIGRLASSLLPPDLDGRDWRAAREKSRLHVLTMRNAVSRALVVGADDEHVLLSYYLSTAGFVADRVSGALDLPHVASARGSDIGRELFTPAEFGPAAEVLRRATRLVTTCEEHTRLALSVGGRRTAVHTVHNPVPIEDAPSWRRSHRTEVSLVTLTGCSMKKGTVVLLEAVAELVGEGLPVTLTIAGPAEHRDWQLVFKRFEERTGGRLRYVGVIPSDQTACFLLGHDCYCSASFSEGCSNATLLALAVGMPVAATATGAVVEIAAGLTHVGLAPPGEVRSFAAELRRLVVALHSGTLEVSREMLKARLAGLTREAEYAQICDILDAATGDHRCGRGAVQRCCAPEKTGP